MNSEHSGRGHTRYFLVGLPELSGQSWTAKDFDNLDKLRERCDHTEIIATPTCNNLRITVNGLRISSRGDALVHVDRKVTQRLS